MGISGLVGSSSRAVATVAPPCLAPLVVSALCRVRALSTCSAAPVAEDSPTSLHPAQKWAIDIMNKQKSLLMRVSPSDYRQAPKHIGSSMGEHLRHTLDHFSTLLEDRKTGTVNYDEKRQRGNIVEQDPVVALANLEKLKKTIKSLTPEELNQTLSVVFHGDLAGSAVSTSSTLARELSFVTHHATHHQAFMGLLAREKNYEMPFDFGLGYSTALHLQKLDEA